jgi:hypothetical protein
VVDLHGIAEARSLAYHRAIAERLASDPAVLERARARVHAWLGAEPDAYFAREWAVILARPLRDIATFLTDSGEHARELRQSTPFAGELDPRERWRLWREVGKRERGRAST